MEIRKRNRLAAHGTRAFVWAWLLGATVSVSGALAQSGAPPIPDILNGQRYLKGTQDVSFVSVYNTDYDFLNVDVITYDTTNSQFGNTTPSDQQTITSTDQISGNNQLPTESPVGVASGRMFNVSNDQFVTLNPSLNIFHNPEADWMFHYYDPPAPNANPPRGSSLQTVRTGNDYQVPFNGGTSSAWVVMGNFRGDGLKEAFGVFANISGNGVDTGMEVLGAQPNGSNPPAVDQLMAGPLFFSSSAGNQTENFISFNQNSVAVGDFNGDGRDEVAIIMADLQTIRFYSVDPNTYAISPMSPATYKLALPVYRTNLVPGRFVNPNRVDLVAVGSDAQPDNLLRFEYINTQSQNPGVFDPQQENPANLPQQPTNPEPPYAFFAYATPLIQPGSQASTFGPEQLVVSSQNAGGDQNFWVGDFYVNQYAFTQLGYTGLGDSGCTLGMQLGNFDHQTSSGSYNAGEQVAFLYNRHGCTSGSPSLFLYSIHVPQNLSPEFQATDWLGGSKSNITVSPSGNNSSSAYPASFTLDVSDVQGRSQQLGAPEIVQVPLQTQPEVVLPMPPMEADYVIPPDPSDCATGTGNGVTEPCAAAITFAPTTQNSKIPAFANQFVSTTNSSQQTHNTATTSWGLSVKTSIGTSISFNDLESSDSVNINDTAKALYNRTVSNQTITGSSSSTSVTAQTLTSDVLFFSQRDMYVYYYPVLGLNDSKGNPVYVEFSIPENLHHFPASPATNYDWYQPVQEPGNVLSYPWSFNQLAQGYSNPLDLRTKRQGFGCQTVGSVETSFSTSWANNSTNSQSVASASSFSNDLSVSASAGAGVTGIDGVSVNESIDLGASTSLSSLNVETATLDAGEGVKETSPGFTNLNGWGYYMAQYIWGEKPPSQTTTWQDISFNTTDPNAPNYYNQATQGPLFVGFIADPAPNLPGGPCSNNSTPPAWGATYTLPDVGVNHPKRWHWNSSSSTIAFNYPNGTDEPTPAGQSTTVNPFISPFYWMKGFFITMQNGAANGPTLTEANDGDQLQLTARIYNFSLKDTDDPTLQQPAAKIYVDFYGQQACGENVCSGTLFKIGEQVLTQAIPGFKSTRYSGQPNWVLTTVPFDTSGRANQNLVFWVVTWMEDANGNRVQEMPGHGLTAIPNGNLTNLLDPTQFALENYSNNVGLYGVHTQFTINPAAASGGDEPGSPSPARPGALKSVLLHGPRTVLLDKDVYLRARVAATGGDVTNVTISYYERNGSSRKLIDTQAIHHIADGGFYVHGTSFQAAGCGTHTISAVASPAHGSAVKSPDFTVKVTVDPAAMISDMLARLRRVGLGNDSGRLLSLNLKLAKQYFEQGYPVRGANSLKVFANTSDDVANTNGAAAQRKLRALAGEARTIVRCLIEPTEVASR